MIYIERKKERKREYEGNNRKDGGGERKERRGRKIAPSRLMGHAVVAVQFFILFHFFYLNQDTATFSLN